MKLLIYPFLILLLVGCTTAGQKWDSTIASKKCFDDATKSKYDLTDIQIKKIKQICNCAGEKMAKQFKTESEVNDKMTEATVIINECVESWKNNPEQ